MPCMNSMSAGLTACRSASASPRSRATARRAPRAESPSAPACARRPSAPHPCQSRRSRPARPRQRRSSTRRAWRPSVAADVRMSCTGESDEGIFRGLRARVRAGTVHQMEGVFMLEAHAGRVLRRGRCSWACPPATRRGAAAGHIGRPAHRVDRRPDGRGDRFARSPAPGQPAEAGRRQRHELGPRLPGRLRVQRQLQRHQHLRHRRPGEPGAEDVDRCPGSQNDVSVWSNLLFVSVESTAAKKDCSSTPAATPETRFRGIRIFDISNIDAPVQVHQVQTCRGSHTHTLVRPKNDPANVYIYVQGTAGVRAATELAGCDGNGAGHRREPVPVADRGHQGPGRGPDPGRDRQRAAPVQGRGDRRAQRPAEHRRRRRSTRRGPTGRRTRTPTPATTSRSMRSSTWPRARARATAC